MVISEKTLYYLYIHMYIDRYTCMQPYDHGVMQGTLLEDAMAESPEELLVAKMM